jgi:hypothetical protein
MRVGVFEELAGSGLRVELLWTIPREHCSDKFKAYIIKTREKKRERIKITREKNTLIKTHQSLRKFDG